MQLFSTTALQGIVNTYGKLQFMIFIACEREGYSHLDTDTITAADTYIQVSAYLIFIGNISAV